MIVEKEEYAQNIDRTILVHGSEFLAESCVGKPVSRIKGRFLSFIFSCKGFVFRKLHRK